MSAQGRPDGKPLTPPPAYSEQPDPRQSLSVTVGPAGSPGSSSTVSPLSFPSHPSNGAYYGPTPIAQQAQLVPYYDPRSPYAVAEATHRARWRFITAMIYAVAILTVLSFVTGLEIQVVMARGRVVRRVFVR